MERNDYLIKKKFYAYLIPGVMMVAALQLGNLLDSVFVGNILGMTALSASNLGMPIVFYAQVPMMILTIGGSTIAGVYIGRRETGIDEHITFFAGDNIDRDRRISAKLHKIADIADFYIITCLGSHVLSIFLLTVYITCYHTIQTNWNFTF